MNWEKLYNLENELGIGEWVRFGKTVFGSFQRVGKTLKTGRIQSILENWVKFQRRYGQQESREKF